MDMKMYEMMEHLRTVQIVQAEQSRRLDDQAYRLNQLEMTNNSNSYAQANRFESQRYLWGPGAIGGSIGGSLAGTPAIGTGMGLGMGLGTAGSSSRGLAGLPGLGFEVFTPSSPRKEKHQGTETEIQIAPDELLHDLHDPTTCVVNGNGI
jgi:hypothetical protein